MARCLCYAKIAWAIAVRAGVFLLAGCFCRFLALLRLPPFLQVLGCLKFTGLTDVCTQA